MWSSDAHLPDDGVPVIPGLSAPVSLWHRILDWHAHWEGAIRINRDLERYEWTSTLPRFAQAVEVGPTSPSADTHQT
ncbi:hypothetical protein QVA66_02700 [Staphylococcus chromogenes]|nr:hypothetical protein [Staphylococcus chromogenes]